MAKTDPTHLEQTVGFSGQRLPPDNSFITLSEAISWVAFQHSLDRTALSEALGMGLPRNTEEASRDEKMDGALRHAVDRLTDLASAGEIELRGRFFNSLMEDESKILIKIVPDELLSNYRQFDVHSDLLHRGDGLAWTGNRRDFPAVTDDHFREVVVRRSDLMKHFPSKRANHRRGRKPGSGSYTTADEALFPKIKALLAGQKAFSVQDAAFLVADEAPGAGTKESKAQRLAKRYRNSQDFAEE